MMHCASVNAAGAEYRPEQVESKDLILLEIHTPRTREGAT